MWFVDTCNRFLISKLLTSESTLELWDAGRLDLAADPREGALLLSKSSSPKIIAVISLQNASNSSEMKFESTVAVAARPAARGVDPGAASGG